MFAKILSIFSRKKVNKEEKIYRYESVEQMEAEFEKDKTPWDRFILNPKMNWLRWLIYNAKDVPAEIKYWTREKYQRAVRGWSVSDAWGMNTYLATIIVDMLRYLKKNKHGYPICCGEDRNKDYSKLSDNYDERNQKKWEWILDEMIWTFETVLKTLDHDWILLDDRKHEKKMQKFCDKMTALYPDTDYHVMTKEESARYRNGWKLFQKYFVSLWD